MTTIERHGNEIRATKDGKTIGSVRVEEHDGWVQATDLTLSDGVSGGVGARLAYEVAKVAGEREIYCRVALDNEKAIRFYIKAGMQIQDLVMVRRK